MLFACVACTATVSGSAVPAGPAAAPGGSDLVASMSANQFADLVMTAVDAASAVHVKGDINGAGTGVDVQLNKDSAAGTMTVNGVALPVVYVGGTLYIQCTDQVLGAIGRGLDYQAFFVAAMGQVRSVPGRATRTGTRTVDGTPAVVYRTGDGSTIALATAAPHYIVRVSRTSGTDRGQLDFSGWNQPTTVTPPPPDQIFTQPHVN